ncbi:MAG: YigZ family protein [Bacteroidales bacterium]|nr:YigZ family protein [Bacteroidales bacterium]
MSDSYYSIQQLSTGLYKEKGSKFIAYAYPVESEDEIKEIVGSIKKKHFDARHHCYAYRIGLNGEKWRMNDDGEPSSTAGKPIYGQILANELSDILIVVVRYFGGILLGTSGLIQAYKNASADAIANSVKVEKRAGTNYNIEFDYLKMNDIMKVLKELCIEPSARKFDNTCSMDMRVRLSQDAIFNDKMKDLTISICQKA